MPKSKALKIVEKYLEEGWVFDGSLCETLNRESDYEEDATLDRDYEYCSVSISFKRKRGEEE